MSRSMRNWLPVLVWCAAIFIQSSFPAPGNLPSFDHSDKLIHVLLYGILGALIFRALMGTHRWHGRGLRLFWVGVTAAFLYGVSDEWHQSFVDGRHATAADLVADAVGAFIGCAVYGKFSGHTRR